MATKKIESRRGKRKLPTEPIKAIVPKGRVGALSPSSGAAVIMPKGGKPKFDADKGISYASPGTYKARKRASQEWKTW